MGQACGKSKSFERERDLIVVEGLYGSGRTTTLASFKLTKEDEHGKDAWILKDKQKLAEELEKATFELRFGESEGYPYKGYRLHSTKFSFGGRGTETPASRNILFLAAVGVVFVIDSSDHSTLGEAKTELDFLRQNPELKDATFIAVANKQDLPEAKSADEIEEFINDGAVNKIKVLPVSATNGEGVVECFDLVVDEILRKQKTDAVTEPWKEVAADVKKDGKAGMIMAGKSLKKFVLSFRIGRPKAA